MTNSRPDDLTPIHYSRHSVSEEDIAAVCEVLRSDFLSQGPKRVEFEKALCELTGAAYCIAVANGTAALHLACLALGVKQGTKVVTSPLTFLASANCIALSGGTPAFVDIDSETLCLSSASLDQYCQNQGAPAVVIPVDFAGVPADLPAIHDLSKKYGFKIIEDAAHSIGSTYTYNNRKYSCGSCVHTDCATFSFHPVKNIMTGEGGAVFTNDKALADRIRMLSSHGIERSAAKFEYFTADRCTYVSGSNQSKELAPWCWEMQELGLNYRLTELQSALGISQLKRLSTWKRRRMEIVNYYNEAFKPLADKGYTVLPTQSGSVDACFHIYVLQLTLKSPVDRNTVYTKLREHNIFPQVHYLPVHLHPFYQKNYGFKQGDFLKSEKYFDHALSLPLYPDLPLVDLDRVIKAVFDCYQ